LHSRTAHVAVPTSGELPRVLAVLAVFLGGRQGGAGGLGFVLGEPAVALEDEGMRFGARSDVEVGLQVAPAEDNPVIGDAHVAARGEAGFAGLLQDAEDPLGRKEDGVAAEVGPVDAHERRRARAALDRVVVDLETCRFMLRALRTEIREPSRSAEIERTVSGLQEVAFRDLDVAGAAFELDRGGSREARLADEAALGDLRLMAADEVDALTAPAGDHATADRQVHEPRALDGVMVAGGADVADGDVFDGHACDRPIELTAVVEVESIAGLPADPQAAHGEPAALGELPAIRAALEVRRILRVQRLDRQVGDARDMVSARVGAGGDPETGALGAWQRA